MTQLLVVESPKKAKVIQGILGRDYDVVATAGHFRDLPPKELGVDLETMDVRYVVHDDKAAIVNRIRARAKHSKQILLGTDPDREGEAIAWHVTEVLGKDASRAKRVRFHEITPDAVREALRSPTPVNKHLVDAQQARRVLDRLCGYQISPLLWPFGRGLSAGRVQSATLHIVVSREQERRRFNKVTFFEVDAFYADGIVGTVVQDEGGKWTPVRVADQAAADNLVAALQSVEHRVRQVEETTRKQNPRPPFTTSALQQVASSVLKIAPERTMQVAQALFQDGHITYHRTDSVALSPEAIQMAREHIASVARDALPENPPKYRSKDGAQEAHEAIRPTSLEMPKGLDHAALQVWKLIRDRFIASQSAPAKLRGTQVILDAGEQTLRIAGLEMVFQGYRQFLDFDESKDAQEQLTAASLQKLTEGQVLQPQNVEPRKSSTKSPPQFTEATLIREMERSGIGRPSTYAPTVKLLRDREYLSLEKRNLVPTELGETVDGFLMQGFADVLEPSFTADLEQALDEIAQGAVTWQPLCQAYQAGLLAQIDRAKKFLPEGSQDNFEARPPRPCSFCDGGSMDFRPGRKGPYWRCGTCSKTLDGEGLDGAKGATCPSCEAPMLRRRSKRGPFLGCSRFPECKHREDIGKLPRPEGRSFRR